MHAQAGQSPAKAAWKVLLIRRSLVRAQVGEPKKASQIKALQRCKAFFFAAATTGYWKDIGSLPISSTSRKPP